MKLERLIFLKGILQEKIESSSSCMSFRNECKSVLEEVNGEIVKRICKGKAEKGAMKEQR